MVDPPLGEQVEGFLPVVSDRVLAGDVDRLDLAGPRRNDFALRGAVAAHVGVVDGKCRFNFRIGIAPRGAPALDGRQRRESLDELGRLSPLSLRRVLVEIDRGAGGVDDEHAAFPGGGDHLVHRDGQFLDALGGPLAPVIVPHVTDDQRGLLRIPFDFLLDSPALRGAVALLHGDGESGVQDERSRFCFHGLFSSGHSFGPRSPERQSHHNCDQSSDQPPAFHGMFPSANEWEIQRIFRRHILTDEARNCTRRRGSRVDPLDAAQ